MRWSFATVGIILLGLVGVAVIILFQNVTTNNENDYYLLKEVTEAAMIDSIDIPYYRETGDLKIVTEKFVENFTRRYAESTLFVTNDYTINFYDIMETPPKVSIVINTGLGEYTINGNSDEYGIANKLDAILEYTGKNTYVTPGNSVYNEPYVSGKTFSEEYYAILFKDSYRILSLKTPDDLIAPNIKNVKIGSIEFMNFVNTQGEINQALLRNELTYYNVKNNLNDYLLSSSDFYGTISSVSIDYHNCIDGKSNYDCDDVNKYFININGEITGNVVLKYKVNWLYDVYEFKS